MEAQSLAIYLRTSLEDYGKAHRLIDQSCSIGNQRKLIQDYISAHEELTRLHPIEYIDDGFTGTNMARPRFRDMIADAKNGRVVCIIVKDLSRLGRSYLEVGDYLERVFPANGIRLISVNDHYDSASLTGTTGGLDIAFRNFIYDSYSKDLSVKVRSAMHTRMEKGKFVNHPPYGYTKDASDKHQMIPDPETAPVVQEIFQKIISGMSTSEVAKLLNGRGIPTPLQYKQHKIKPVCRNRTLLWSHVTVLNIVQNYKYTGAMVNHICENRYLRDPSPRRTAREERIITEGTHEALITKSEFELANQKLRHPKKAMRRTEHFQDNVFYCAYCGRKLQKTFGNDTYFSCCTPKYAKNVPCANLKWSKTALENVLTHVYRIQISLIGETLTKFQRQDRASDVTVFSQRMERIEQELALCDRQKMHLFESYHDGALDLGAFMEKKAEIINRQAKLREDRTEAQKACARAKAENTARLEGVQKLSGFLRGDDLSREQILTHMYEDLDRVMLSCEKKMEIRWKFDDFLSAARKALEIP